MRRRFRSNTEFPLTKTTGDIARNRRFQKPSETGKVKRVRFDDAETDDSSRGHEATQSPRCDGPKTSEYAYFRKVKDGAVNGQFRAPQKEKKPLKSSKIDHFLTEAYKASEKLEWSTENVNFSISGESPGPSGRKHFVSPPVSKYGESYEMKRKELTHKTKKRPPLPTETITPVRQSLATPLLNHETESSENRCMDKGIFDEKRKRLCQWVADTTSSEVEKLRRNGPDVVSFLLSRLIPKGNENNDSSKGDADNSSGSLTVYESDNMEKELPLSHKTDCHKYLSRTRSGGSSEIELRECESFSPGFPSNYREECDLQNKTMDHPGRSKEIVLCEREGFESGFLYDYHRQSDLRETMDLDQHSDSRMCNSSGRQPSFSFYLPYESFRSLGAFHFKDLDEFGPIIGHGREEPYRYSLEMDFDLGKERLHTTKDVCHRLANAWNDDQQIIVDNMLDTKGFSPSPLFSSRYMSKPLLNYVSTDCSMHEVGQDDMKYAMVEPGHFSLTSPSSPKCITFPEDKTAEKVLSNSSLMFSYSDLRWPEKKIWDCTPGSDFWWECLPAPEFSAGDHPSPLHAWQSPQNGNCLNSLALLKDAPREPFTPFYEGAFDNYLFSSTLHSPLDAFMNCPLLLNHVSHDILDQELYSDDYNELRF